MFVDVQCDGLLIRDVFGPTRYRSRASTLPMRLTGEGAVGAKADGLVLRRRCLNESEQWALSLSLPTRNRRSTSVSRKALQCFIVGKIFGKGGVYGVSDRTVAWNQPVSTVGR